MGRHAFDEESERTVRISQWRKLHDMLGEALKTAETSEEEEPEVDFKTVADGYSALAEMLTGKGAGDALADPADHRRDFRSNASDMSEEERRKFVPNPDGGPLVRAGADSIRGLALDERTRAGIARARREQAERASQAQPIVEGVLESLQTGAHRYRNRAPE